jgi:hypothetical protein
MVLLALERPVEEALEALRARYVADGWTMRPMADPRRQTERGWLVWFTRGRSHRVVFVQVADEAKETLAAVCDLGYE